jgi:hypothetical protein
VASLAAPLSSSLIKAATATVRATAGAAAATTAGVLLLFTHKESQVISHGPGPDFQIA